MSQTPIRVLKPSSAVRCGTCRSLRRSCCVPYLREAVDGEQLTTRTPTDDEIERARFDREPTAVRELFVPDGAA